jgi:hypothetical protein
MGVQIEYLCQIFYSHMGKIMTTYSVIITMDSTTNSDLKEGNFYLYGFKAVSTAANASPLVWFQTDKSGYNTTTTISWTEEYQAYISNSEIIAGGTITAGTSIGISLDQTATVDQNGNLTSTSGGQTDAISIQNGSGTQYTAGISQTQGTATTLVCAVPLYGSETIAIAPVEQVLLMFATTSTNAGAYIENAFSQGILIDLTGATSRSVSYDINAGWSWGSATWASAVNNGAELTPLLITN